ncbi:hypothetical protein RDWZM_005051 [Blomia tropicalis]|uniref:Ragulator complex protein LAMTOR1 n=1 Tax=Blomia tropicalis TaxID=40697 RepID=A0A9Q0M5I7_BLOTA|nr:hypothetical protein RDWZM_005051 [Blomia tropicalis]
MGGLCCCLKKDEYFEDGFNNESRPILDNQGINDGDRRDSQYPISVSNQVYGSIQANGLRQASEDLQNQMYNRVLNQLSSRVIDISSIEKSGEQADLTDREYIINQKLSSVRRSVMLDSKKTTPSRSDHSLFKSREPIPMDDYRLIINIAAKSATAVEYGFRIHDSEPFVVNFDNAPY